MLCNTLPRTFPSNVIIKNRTLKATECNTNQQHPMTQHVNISCNPSAIITESLQELLSKYYTMNPSVWKIETWFQSEILYRCHCVNQTNKSETVYDFSPLIMHFQTCSGMNVTAVQRQVSEFNWVLRVWSSLAGLSPVWFWLRSR